MIVESHIFFKPSYIFNTKSCQWKIKNLLTQLTKIKKKIGVMSNDVLVIFLLSQLTVKKFY